MGGALNSFIRKARLSIWVLLICIMSFSKSGDAATLRPDAGNGPTPVETAVYIADVDEIDSANQSFTANVFYRLIWNDPRLKHPGPTPEIKPLDMVWHPDVQIVNQQRLWKTFPDNVTISPEGKVKYIQRVWGSFSQPLNLYEFPRDTQKFNITFVSVGHPSEDVEFITPEGNGSLMAEVLSLADWEVSEAGLYKVAFSPSPGSNVVSGFNMEFTAERKTGYFLIKIIIPLVLIVMMSWVVFWIDPSEAGTQIGVSMTAMLTLIAYRFAVGAMLPKVSYLTRMDWFILSSTALVFTSMVEVVFTSSLSRNGKHGLAIKLDTWARVIFPLVFIALTIACFGL